MTIRDLASVAWDAYASYMRSIGHGRTHVVGMLDVEPQGVQDKMDSLVGRILAGASPEDLHEFVCERLSSDGWVFAPEADEDAKRSPDMGPWAQTSLTHRKCFYLMHAVVTALSRSV